MSIAKENANPNIKLNSNNPVKSNINLNKQNGLNKKQPTVPVGPNLGIRRTSTVPLVVSSNIKKTENSLTNSTTNKSTTNALNARRGVTRVSTSNPPPSKRAAPVMTPALMSQRIQAMETFTQDLKGQVENLNFKLIDRDSELSKASQDRSFLQKDLNNYSQLIEKSQERNKELGKLMEDAELRHNRETEILNSKILMIQSKLDGSELDLKVARGEISRLQLVISENLDKIQSLEKNLFETEQKLKKTESLADEREIKINELDENVAKLSNQVLELEAQARNDEEVRRQLHNSILELKGNIRVFCRVRPGIESDNVRYIFNKYDNTSMEIVQKQYSDVTGNKNVPDKRYSYKFDRVFPSDSTQELVFREISQLVQSALDGYNTCIFAYGQTGSGKTYTMEGPPMSMLTEETEGMINRAVRQIYITSERLKEKGWEYEMHAGFLEIYNEHIRDLLDSNSESKKFEIKHDPETSRTSVMNQKIVKVTNPQKVAKLLQIASNNRSVGATLVNERSSRSHSVFQLRIVGRNTISGQNCEGLLNLIDLAGSERVSVSGATGDRFTETKNINKSLSCLNDVISALANKEKHIPYRNSKLTYLLQNSLGGNSKTLMFVNISPDQENFNETLSSLRFASRVNACEIGTARKGGKIDLSAP